jgi:hypothetical protein
VGGEERWSLKVLILQLARLEDIVGGGIDSDATDGIRWFSGTMPQGTEV